MLISIIAAMDCNRVIGKNNDIPWRLPKDWAYVMKTTMGHPIIMGRKNFESIGKVLPGRRNIILTRDKEYFAEGTEIVHSLEKILISCENEEEIFIFGGEQIYRLFLPLVDKMYITNIDYEFEGDTYFPEFDLDQWVQVTIEKGITDEKNPFTYYFHVYERRK
jgi:dihydrofolate reductase